MKKVGIILRGHIRVAFDNKLLYELIKNLNNLYNIDIYIHTWNFKEAKVSYRKLVEANKKITVNEELIKNYFGDLSNNIKNIFIDDDEKIVLKGDTTGTITNCKIPKIAWKRMWYSIHKNTEFVKNTYIDYDFVINTRFDLFNNTNNLNFNTIIEVLKNTSNFNKINFYHKELTTGIDNFFYGKIDKIYQLCKSFHENLDSILQEFSPYVNRHQEFYPYYQSLKINDKKELELVIKNIIDNRYLILKKKTKKIIVLE